MHDTILAAASGLRPLVTVMLAWLATPGYAQSAAARGRSPNYPPSGAALLHCALDDNYRHCRADTHDDVRLYRQLSNSACRYNDTWGYDRCGVWVDPRCRGGEDVKPSFQAFGHGLKLKCQMDDHFGFQELTAYISHGDQS